MMLLLGCLGPWSAWMQAQAAYSSCLSTDSAVHFMVSGVHAISRAAVLAGLLSCLSFFVHCRLRGPFTGECLITGVHMMDASFCRLALPALLLLPLPSFSEQALPLMPCAQPRHLHFSLTSFVLSSPTHILNPTSLPHTACPLMSRPMPYCVIFAPQDVAGHRPL